MTFTDLINVTSSITSSITSIISIVFQIDFKLKHVLSSDVTMYEKNVSDLASLVEAFQNVFQDFDIIVNISKKKWMSINFKSDAMFKINKIYSLKVKNRQFVDETFDKLYKQEKFHWTTQFTEFSYSIFVIWRNTFAEEKKRVIVDIRGFNDITQADSYPLSLQQNVIAEVIDLVYIFTMNAVDWFHQFSVKRFDRHKFTIVNHKEQKKFNVTFMNYKSSSSYVQRQTNKLLRSYKNYVKAYMNDIIVHFSILQNHLIHLHILFEMFRVKRISLTITKIFLTYSFVTLLKQKINNLKMSTTAKKIVVITSLRFFRNFRNLKIFMKLIDWIRSFILRYAQRAQPLQKRKIILIKKVTVSDSTRKKQIVKIHLYESIHEKKAVFRNLQEAFAFFIFLIHFDKRRRLYINLNVFKQ